MKKNNRIFLRVAVTSAFMVALTMFAAKPADFKSGEIENIWKEIWKSGAPKIQVPKLEKLSEGEVDTHMKGKWTVMFGFEPDKLTLSISTNHLVEVSGQKDGKAWKKTGQWRVDSNKLVLFLEEDDLPSFIFRTRKHIFIFDPWTEKMMSELKKEK